MPKPILFQQIEDTLLEIEKYLDVDTFLDDSLKSQLFERMGVFTEEMVRLVDSEIFGAETVQRKQYFQAWKKSMQSQFVRKSVSSNCIEGKKETEGDVRELIQYEREMLEVFAPFINRKRNFEEYFSSEAVFTDYMRHIELIFNEDQWEGEGIFGRLWSSWKHYFQFKKKRKKISELRVKYKSQLKIELESTHHLFITYTSKGLIEAYEAFCLLDKNFNILMKLWKPRKFFGGAPAFPKPLERLYLQLKEYLEHIKIELHKEIFARLDHIKNSIEIHGGTYQCSFDDRLIQFCERLQEMEREMLQDYQALGGQETNVFGQPLRDILKQAYQQLDGVKSGCLDQPAAMRLVEIVEPSLLHKSEYQKKAFQKFYGDVSIWNSEGRRGKVFEVTDEGFECISYEFFLKKLQSMGYPTQPIQGFFSFVFKKYNALVSQYKVLSYALYELEKLKVKYVKILEKIKSERNRAILFQALNNLLEIYFKKYESIAIELDQAIKSQESLLFSSAKNSLKKWKRWIQENYLDEIKQSQFQLVRRVAFSRKSVRMLIQGEEAVKIGRDEIGDSLGVIERWNQRYQTTSEEYRAIDQWIETQTVFPLESAWLSPVIGFLNDLANYISFGKQEVQLMEVMNYWACAVSRKYAHIYAFVKNALLNDSYLGMESFSKVVKDLSAIYEGNHQTHPLQVILMYHLVERREQLSCPILQLLKDAYALQVITKTDDERVMTKFSKIPKKETGDEIKRDEDAFQTHMVWLVSIFNRPNVIESDESLTYFSELIQRELKRDDLLQYIPPTQFQKECLMHFIGEQNIPHFWEQYNQWFERCDFEGLMESSESSIRFSHALVEKFWNEENTHGTFQRMFIYIQQRITLKKIMNQFESDLSEMEIQNLLQSLQPHLKSKFLFWMHHQLEKKPIKSSQMKRIYQIGIYGVGNGCVETNTTYADTFDDPALDGKKDNGYPIEKMSDWYSKIILFLRDGNGFECFLDPILIVAVLEILDVQKTRQLKDAIQKRLSEDESVGRPLSMCLTAMVSLLGQQKTNTEDIYFYGTYVAIQTLFQTMDETSWYKCIQKISQSSMNETWLNIFGELLKKLSVFELKNDPKEIFFQRKNLQQSFCFLFFKNKLLNAGFSEQLTSESISKWIQPLSKEDKDSLAQDADVHDLIQMYLEADNLCIQPLILEFGTSEQKKYLEQYRCAQNIFDALLSTNGLGQMEMDSCVVKTWINQERNLDVFLTVIAYFLNQGSGFNFHVPAYICTQLTEVRNFIGMIFKNGICQLEVVQALSKDPSLSEASLCRYLLNHYPKQMWILSHLGEKQFILTLLQEITEKIKQKTTTRLLINSFDMGLSLSQFGFFSAKSSGIQSIPSALPTLC